MMLQGVFTAPSQLHGFLISWALFAWSCSLRCAWDRYLSVRKAAHLRCKMLS